MMGTLDKCSLLLQASQRHVQAHAWANISVHEQCSTLELNSVCCTVQLHCTFITERHVTGLFCELLLRMGSVLLWLCPVQILHVDSEEGLMVHSSSLCGTTTMHTHIVHCM